MKKSILIITLIFFFKIGFNQTVIKMEKKGGVYYVPCIVNGLKLKFIFDTGAGDVSISLSEAVFMIKNGYMKEEDLIGTEYYRIANGDVAEGTKIIISKLEIGEKILYNVQASIVHTLSAPLLLGQSAIERLGKFSIDYSTNTLIFGETVSNYNQKLKNKTSTLEEKNESSPANTYYTEPPQIITNVKQENFVSQKKYNDNCRYPVPLPANIKKTIKILYLEGKFADCAKKYDTLVLKYPDYCIGYYNRGLARLYSGNKEGAKNDFEKAISLGFLEANELLIKHFGQ